MYAVYAFVHVLSRLAYKICIKTCKVLHIVSSWGSEECLPQGVDVHVRTGCVAKIIRNLTLWDHMRVTLQRNAAD